MTESSNLFAFDQCSSYPLPGNRILVRNPRNGNHAILTPDVYGALTGCTTFLTLEQHAARLAADNPGLAGQEEAVVQVLESVRQQGLMISAEIYEIQLAPSGRSVSLADRPVVAITTCDRPKELARLLGSIVENCDLAGIERIFVIDDSREPEHREHNHHLCINFAAEQPVKLGYMGQEEQAEFANKICELSPSLEDAVRFLIDRERWSAYWSSGVSRNIALLLSAGKRLVMLDDDVLCSAFDPPVKSDGPVSFSGQVRDTRFYKEDSEWLETGPSDDRDAIARHMRQLGLPLADALTSLGIPRVRQDSFVDTSVEFLEGIDANSPVLVTECGSLGDPGTASINWITGLEGESLNKLTESEESVELALTRRNCWIGRKQPHITSQSRISQITGLDNRRPLPPYIPIMRNEDRLFGDMLKFIFPDSVCVDQAWAAPHLSPGERTWGPEAAEFRTSETFPQFFMRYVGEHQKASPITDPVRRTGNLARLIENLAESDHDQLVRQFIDERLETMSFNYRHLTRLREMTADGPTNWLAFIDRALAQMNAEIIDNPVDLRLRGYPPGLEGEALTAWWQDFWKRFGHAIRSWPAIRQAARRCLA